MMKKTIFGGLFILGVIWAFLGSLYAAYTDQPLLVAKYLLPCVIWLLATGLTWGTSD
jgi:hypothetical protein